MVGQCAADGLADPPGRVGGELVAAAVLELVHRSQQSDVAFLDQVEQRQAAVVVPLGDRHDQSQVGLGHLVLGLGRIRARLANPLDDRAQRGGMPVGRRRRQRLGQAGAVALPIEDLEEGPLLAQRGEDLLLVTPDLGLEPRLVGATSVGLLAEHVAPVQPAEHGREAASDLPGDDRPLLVRRLRVSEIDDGIDVDLLLRQARGELLQSTAAGVSTEDCQNHLLPRLLHPPGEFHLASRRQQRHRAHLAQVNPDRILDPSNRRLFNHGVTPAGHYGKHRTTFRRDGSLRSAMWWN